MALRENGCGKLYAIDPHTTTNWNDSRLAETFGIMQDNIHSCGLDEYIEIIRTTSDEALKEWNLPIDMLFIDGDHSYEGVRHDWESFSPFLTEFGVTIFHDTIWDLIPVSPDHPLHRPDMGAPRFVDDLRNEGYPVLTIDKDFGVSIVQRAKSGIPLCN